MNHKHLGWFAGTFRGTRLGLLVLGVVASQAATAGPIQLFEVDPDIVLVNFDSFTGGAQTHHVIHLGCENKE